ncbi:SRPBCC family protein [Paraglaciecola chathamensis]|jgi:uncharacterized protein YndB with AHSA1/START domain|uniref:SRPBCC domain-containing protein n=2 Tax=Paraglaciecola chathamensis TaxID=368405 RepID=A0ABS0WJR7_9ALTE|nr:MULTISPECIES: SRPBCC family protein [Paraglaciecola]MBJ2138663.1 SRPBCC domain-containing protein [Paraglaciecola chathamensis]MBN27319.1 polyketide cyclase/dehydrase [Alteromonadaceae bacterium]GAC08162.1 hypothetical protein GCHA_0197 [Paraglaciecola chathamensis S18K6]|tara:strand:+ start:16904 stop:17452 length:549 start_codon:yes stop_codon:yes gene_type:complete
MLHFTHIKKFIYILSLGLSFSFSSHASVKQLNEHGFTLENTVLINAPAKQVWAALVSDIDYWWPKDHTWWGNKGTLTLRPVAGGCFCETAGENSAEHMRISFVEVNHILRMTGGLGPLQGMGIYGALTWQLTAQNNRTKLVLTYQAHGVIEGNFTELAPIVDRVQNSQLMALAEYIKPTNPD